MHQVPTAATLDIVLLQAVQFHLHWAKNGSNGGSEHTLNGVQYFAELHIVHYDTQYESISDAVNKDAGLAVLGFFITVRIQPASMFKKSLELI